MILSGCYSDAMNKYPCPVCRALTFDKQDQIGDICPFCWWELDGWQDDVDDINAPMHGPNSDLGVLQARKNYHALGASQKDLVEYVSKRKPRKLAFPTKQEIIQMTQWLIDSDLTPLYVEIWASEFLTPTYQQEYEAVELQNKPLTELLDALAIAAMTHDGTAPMYNQSSYREWLDEYYKDSKE